jgi:hypothetical protein
MRMKNTARTAVRISSTLPEWSWSVLEDSYLASLPDRTPASEVRLPD